MTPGEEVVVYHAGEGPPQPHMMFLPTMDHSKPIKWKNVAVTLAMLTVVAAFGAIFFVVVTNARKIDSTTGNIDQSTSMLSAKSIQIADMMDDMDRLFRSFRTINTTQFVQDIAESARSSRVLMKALRRKRSISIMLPFLEKEDEEDEESTGEESAPEPTPPPRGNRPKPREPVKGNV